MTRPRLSATVLVVEGFDTRIYASDGVVVMCNNGPPRVSMRFPTTAQGEIVVELSPEAAEVFAAKLAEAIRGARELAAAAPDPELSRRRGHLAPLPREPK